jgi:hypothetical protein
MKKVLLLNAMLLLSTCMFAQTLKKGSLLGLHKGTVTLSPNVTMEQFKKYYFTNYVPEFCKLFKVNLVEVNGVRGADVKKATMTWLYFLFLNQNLGINILRPMEN